MLQKTVIITISNFKEFSYKKNNLNENGAKDCTYINYYCLYCCLIMWQHLFFLSMHVNILFTWNNCDSIHYPSGWYSISKLLSWKMGTKLTIKCNLSTIQKKEKIKFVSFSLGISLSLNASQLPFYHSSSRVFSTLEKLSQMLPLPFPTSHSFPILTQFEVGVRGGFLYPHWVNSTIIMVSYLSVSNTWLWGQEMILEGRNGSRHVPPPPSRKLGRYLISAQQRNRLIFPLVL